MIHEDWFYIRHRETQQLLSESMRWVPDRHLALGHFTREQAGTSIGRFLRSSDVDPNALEVVLGIDLG